MSDQWATDVPELSTRPDAVLAMASTPKLRRDILRTIDDMFGVSTRLAGHACASECLAAIWAARKKSLHDSWHGRLEHQVFAQCHGTIRNAYHNAVRRASPTRPLDMSTHGHDVVRDVPEWLHPPRRDAG